MGRVGKLFHDNQRTGWIFSVYIQFFPDKDSIQFLDKNKFFSLGKTSLLFHMDRAKIEVHVWRTMKVQCTFFIASRGCTVRDFN